MYRNLYDTDTTTWSPQGRLHQVEYAMEGVKLGTCGVGVRSNTHVVIAGLKRTLSKLAGYNSKVFRIDDHMGLAFSGITADAKYLADYMRKECLAHRYIYDSFHPLGSLVAKVGTKSQLNTQRYSKRPYGCGLIIGGVDKSGPHLFETCPSGNYNEYQAIALGSRSQSAKTYLEKVFRDLPAMPEDKLIMHAVRALQCSVTQDQELTNENMSVGLVSLDATWRELGKEELDCFLRQLPAAGSAPVDAAAVPSTGATPAQAQMTDIS